MDENESSPCGQCWYPGALLELALITRCDAVVDLLQETNLKCTLPAGVSDGLEAFKNKKVGPVGFEPTTKGL